MAKKIQLQDANGNVLHPLTLGECVTMSNGENLDTLMSKSQMFTPTITQDKSMFKVGTGVDVDYSANVKDGAYESLVFKGKSLVNISQFEKLFEATPSVLDTQSVIWYGNTSKHYVSLSMFKPNTKYIVKIGSETPSRFRGIYISGLNMSNPNGYYTEHNGVFTTPSTIPTEANMYIKGVTGETITKAEYSKCQILILEYQEGMENWDTPYFTGLCDSKMPILRNVGKNLLCTQDYSPKGTITNVEVTQNTLKATAEGVWHGFEYILQLKPNTEYTFSFERDSDTTRGYIRHPENKGWTGGYGGSSNYTFTTRSTGVIRFTIESSLANNTIVVRNPMIIEGSLRPISYENHKTNILRTSEEVVLREVNGVQDTYNALTGEYVKRIGECVLDGSQALSLDGSLVYLELTDRPINDFGIADKMPVITVNQLVTGEFGICMQDRGASGRIYINIEGLTTREEILQHLRTNPITIHYGLVEPVTTIVKPSTTTPFAYQNGHVIVESGHEGQSLLPEVEYSVVTGRAGQVTQNAKVLRKQEQQIIGLEELLLTQVVQMEYERTLLQFDYELQMMMLG